MTNLPDPPAVSVVIPAQNAADEIGGAVESALRQPEVDEVVVAVGDEATREAIERIQSDKVRVVANPEGTTPKALNLGWRASRGDVIVRCDAHARLPEGYVGRALATLRRTDAANVGGMQVPIGITPWEMAVAAAMTSPLGAGDARYRIGGVEGPVETVYLGVFRKEALVAVGGFDERFLRNQDYELNHRLIESGRVVWFDPELRVEYRPRGSLSTLAQQYFRFGQSKRHFAREHPRSLRWRQLAAPGLVIANLGSIILAATGWRIAGLVPISYVMTTGVVGATGPRNLGWRVAALVPPVLWTIHFSWGSGFLLGEPNGKPKAQPPDPN